MNEIEDLEKMHEINANTGNDMSDKTRVPLTKDEENERIARRIE